MAKRLRVGGAAQLDGVMIRSEHFSATVRYIEGSDARCELIEKQVPAFPRWLEIISKIPLLRGLSLPLVLAWNLKGGNALTEKAVKREASTSEKIIAIIVLLAIFAPFVWLSGFLSPGLARNAVALAPLLLLFICGIAWMRSSTPEALKYHGAEHKAVWVYDRSGCMPDAKLARQQSRFHPRCGSCLIANQFAVLAACSLAFPNLSVLWVCLIMQVASTELMALAGLGLFGKALNAAGLALQCITTIEPEERHLRVASAATRAVLDLEAAMELPELPRTRTFKDLDELEEKTGWSVRLPE